MSSKTKNLHDEEIQFTGQFQKTVFQTLLEAYRPFLIRVSICVAIGLLGRGFLLGNANIIGIWADVLAGQREPGSFMGLDHQGFIWLLSLMIGVGFLFTTIYRLGLSRLSALAVSQLHDETILRTSRMPIVFFDRTPAGRIITRFSSDYGNVFRIFGGPLAEFGAIVFDLICMIFLIAWASIYYLPLVFVISVFYYWVFRRNQNRLRASRRELSKSRSPSIAHFAETAQGASTVRVFGKEKSFRERFSILDRNYLGEKLKTVKVVVSFSFQMNLVTGLLYLLMGVVSLWLLEVGQITIGSIGVAFSFVTLAGNTVQMFFEWLATFEEALVGVERLDDYLRKPLEEGTPLPMIAKFKTGQHQVLNSPTAHVWPKASGVEFKNVHFRYQAHLPMVLKNVSFSVQPGERFGIIGRTGSGKSSLVQALFHLYPTERGSIELNGLKPDLTFKGESGTVSLEDFRSAISYISQESVLFRGTLFENLMIQKGVPEREIYSALKQVGLEAWANPEGLSLLIEEKGRNLSQGEKQLICMARCLLQESSLVVMDEATSNVDPQSEEMMVKATEEFFKGKTQLIIAHRLSTLKKCDRVMWLKEGQVHRIGPPEEILPLFERDQSP